MKQVTLKSLYEEAQKVFDYVDPDILNDFPKSVKQESSNFTGSTSVTRFKKEISHRDIIECEKVAGSYQEFTVTEGIRKAIELVKNGEIEERGKGVIIYLSTRNSSGNFCRLDVCRNSDGELGLYVYGLYLGGVWSLGCGVLSKVA